jgi:hypothetical protein
VCVCVCVCLPLSLVLVHVVHLCHGCTMHVLPVHSLFLLYCCSPLDEVAKPGQIFSETRCSSAETPAVQVAKPKLLINVASRNSAVRLQFCDLPTILLFARNSAIYPQFCHFARNSAISPKILQFARSSDPEAGASAGVLDGYGQGGAQMARGAANTLVRTLRGNPNVVSLMCRSDEDCKEELSRELGSLSEEVRDFVAVPSPPCLSRLCVWGGGWGGDMCPHLTGASSIILVTPQGFFLSLHLFSLFPLHFPFLVATGGLVIVGMY